LGAWHNTWVQKAGEFGWHVDNVFGLAQVMRLPGTLNLKLDPTLAYILECHWERRYELSDFEKYLLPTPEPEKKTPSVREGGRDVSPLSAYERFCAAYEEVTGDGPPPEAGNWLCPAHDHHKPSLSVTAGDGLLLLKCHNGCETEDVVAVLGRRFGTGTLLSSHPRTNFDGKVPKRCSFCAMTCAMTSYLSRVSLFILQLRVLDLAVGTTPVGSFHVGALMGVCYGFTASIPHGAAAGGPRSSIPHQWWRENSTLRPALSCGGYG